MFSGPFSATFGQNSGPYGHQNSYVKKYFGALLSYLAEFSATWQMAGLPGPDFPFAAIYTKTHMATFMSFPAIKLFLSQPFSQPHLTLYSL